jgi:hypothetical protein
MDTEDVSLLKPSNIMIHDPFAKRCVERLLCSAWHIRRTLTHLPAPKPVALHRSHINQIVQKKYAVGCKSDGVRYVLVLLKVHGKPMSAMVDMELNMYQIEVFAPHSRFYGSVYDGELVLDCDLDILTFVVFDCSMHNGKYVGKKNFTQRYQIVGDTFPCQADWGVSSEDSKLAETLAVVDGRVTFVPPTMSKKSKHLRVIAKQFVAFEHLGGMLRMKHRFRSDGIIFMPIDEPVGRNTQYSMFKWKFEPTIDVIVKQTAHEYQSIWCCADNGRQIRLEDEVGDVTLDMKNVQCDGVDMLIETTVKVTSDGVLLIFYRHRTDKSMPNHINTIRDILKECVEDITIDDLVDISGSDRSVAHHSDPPLWQSPNQQNHCSNDSLTVVDTAM